MEDTPPHQVVYPFNCPFIPQLIIEHLLGTRHWVVVFKRPRPCLHEVHSLVQQC